MSAAESRRVRVLFVCTGNSARSQMAEGFLRALGGDRFDATSAGTEPRGVHPLAIEVMRESGLDISTHRSKDVADLLPEQIDWVVTVCDLAKERCPIFPFALRREHWSLEDPARVQGTEEERRALFRHVRDEIAERVRTFVKQLEEKRDARGTSKRP